MAVFNNSVPPSIGLRPPDYGKDAIVKTLRDEPGVDPEFIEDLELDTLMGYDVVVMPNFHTPGADLTENWERNIHSYVQAGGGALLIHHSVGFGRFSEPAFAEIGKGPDYVKNRSMEVVADHPVVNAAAVKATFPTEVNDDAFAHRFKELQLPAGTRFLSGFPDYVIIEPGPQGQIIVKSTLQAGVGDDPVVVVGKVAQGRVVLSGMSIGCRCLPDQTSGWNVDDHITAEERAILVNSVFWLAGR